MKALKLQKLFEERNKQINKYNSIHWENTDIIKRRLQLKKEVNKLSKKISELKNPKDVQFYQEDTKLRALLYRITRIAEESWKTNFKIVKRRNSKHFEYSSFWIVKDLWTDLKNKMFIWEYIDLNQESDENILEDYFWKYY